MAKFLALIALGLSLGLVWAADFPSAEIANGQIRAKIYLPDPKNGYYRATRFDWSGVISSLKYKGHDYFGQWFETYNPKTHDDFVRKLCEKRTIDCEQAPTLLQQVGRHLTVFTPAE